MYCMFADLCRSLSSIMTQAETDCDTLLSSLGVACDNSKQTLTKFSQDTNCTNQDIHKFANQVSNFCMESQKVINYVFLLFLGGVTSLVCGLLHTRRKRGEGSDVFVNKFQTVTCVCLSMYDVLLLH